MLKNLMRMEERIVLDGAVAAAAAGGDAAAGNTADAAGAPEGLAPLNPDNENGTSTNSENEESGEQSEIAVAGMDAEGNPDAVEAEHAIAAMESALDNINNAENSSNPLKALIVNTDIADSADLIAAAADDIIVITYDNDTADMESVLNQLDAIAGEREYESIALATHSGAGGEIILTDNEHISAQSLSSDSEQIAFFSGIGEMLIEDGRIDLLSCYSGSGDSGESLIEAIENISGAEVSASTDATGNEAAGGDWLLEKGGIAISSIYFDEIKLNDYDSTMSTELQRILGEVGGNYASNFGYEIAVDGGLAVITTKSAADDFQVYTYNNATSQWGYLTSLKINSLSTDIGTTSAEIVDMELDNQNLIVSVQGVNSNEIVYVFADVAPGRTGVNETFKLTATDNVGTDDFFGEDIAIDGNAIFVSNLDNKGTTDITDDISSIFVYNYDGTNWGVEVSGTTRKESKEIVINTGEIGPATGADTISLDADHVSGTDTYNVAVSISSGESNIGKVYVYEGLESTAAGTDGTKEELTFTATSYGGDASSHSFGSDIAINDNVVVVGMSGYQTATTAHTDMGALLVYKAADAGGWSTGEGSLTGVFTLNTAYTLCSASLGSDNITLGDNGEMFATAYINSTYKTFGWNITNQLATSAVEVVTPTISGTDGYDTYSTSDGDTTPVSALAYSKTTKKLLVGSISADKDVTSVTETGVVYNFNITNYTYPYMDQPSTSYTPGSGAGDMGDYIVTFTEPTTIATESGNLAMEFYNMLTSQSTPVEFTGAEAAQLFNASSTQLTFDLNNAKFSFITDNSQYSIYIPKDTFKDSSGCRNPDISYTLTVIEGTVVITPTVPQTPSTDTPSDQSGDSGFDTDSSLGDLLAMLGEGLGDGLDSLLGLGDSRFTDLMSAADALGMGFGGGIALGINDAINMGLGMSDALAMADAIGMGEGLPGAPEAGQEGMGEDTAPATEAAMKAAREAAAKAAAEGATPAEIAEAAAEAAKEALPSEGENPEGEAGEEVAEGEGEEAGEEAAEEGEETAEGEEAAEGEETTEGDNQGETTAEAGADNQGESEGESENSTESQSTQASASTGSTQNMIVNNPYSESISAQQTSALFSSSIQAFSSLALGNGGLVFGMAQDAMGDTMTTAALVSSSEQILDAAREFLALIDADDMDIYALSGNGYTAATESVSMIIEDAIAAMVEARGNALVANDLLRILSINIKGFDDRIAGNSFSAGVQRLASCNQELAYSYEVLNSILKAVQTAKNDGTPLTVAELNELLPQIEKHATEVSLSVSEKGDRASKDVLTFLTKRLQQNGIDKDNLQAQVDDIFKEWHSNLGLSAPVTADQINIDLAQAM